MHLKIELEIGVSSALMALIEMAGNGSFGDRRPDPVSPRREPEPSMKPAPAENIAPVEQETQSGEGELDAAGWPWSPELHASTKGTTKDGLWRMKVGVSRPDPKPGYPKADAVGNGATGTSSAGAASSGSGTAGSAAAGPATDEDDEFAAFRAAADKANAADAAAANSVPARKWTDADLGALCNQAAVKLGDPTPVKTIIGEFVPEGQIPHSRNVPEGDRAAFAAAVEKAAGITFAG